MSDTAPIEHTVKLTSGDFTAADEPLRLFAGWLKDASAAEPRDPTAMTLATVDADGMPNARMVLLKGADERGFVFFTNMDSKKGQELDARPLAALVFYWKSLNRQVRVRGEVERVTDAALPRDIAGTIEIDPVNGPHGFRPVYLHGRQADDAKVWASAMFIRFA